MLSREEFVRRYGGIYEQSPWVAEAVFEAHGGITGTGALAQAMAACVEDAGPERQLALIRRHPDLAPRGAGGRRLTAASSAEQRSAGIDRCTAQESRRFRELNRRYRRKFGFPFVMAVRGRDPEAILDAFERRLGNDSATEFRRALDEIHRIARLRLDATASETA